MNLSDLRNYVRTQTQTIQSELPDSTVDLYLQEAFNRTVAYENQWPSYEKTWELTQLAGSATIDQPGDINVPAITGLYKVRPGQPGPTTDSTLTPILCVSNCMDRIRVHRRGMPGSRCGLTSCSCGRRPSLMPMSSGG